MVTRTSKRIRHEKATFIVHDVRGRTDTRARRGNASFRDRHKSINVIPVPLSTIVKANDLSTMKTELCWSGRSLDIKFSSPGYKVTERHACVTFDGLIPRQHGTLGIPGFVDVEYERLDLDVTWKFTKEEFVEILAGKAAQCRQQVLQLEEPSRLGLVRELRVLHELGLGLVVVAGNRPRFRQGRSHFAISRGYSYKTNKKFQKNFQKISKKVF